jgi:hypothetical protein
MDATKALEQSIRSFVRERGREFCEALPKTSPEFWMRFAEPRGREISQPSSESLTNGLRQEQLSKLQEG